MFEINYTAAEAEQCIYNDLVAGECVFKFKFNIK